MGEVFVYIRRSPGSQSTQLQFEELRAISDAHLPSFEFASRTGYRPAFSEMLAGLSAGDTVLVSRLHALGRSFKELVESIEALTRKGVTIRSLREDIDTSTENGRAFLEHLACVKEFERDLIHDQAVSGFIAARQRGRGGGRPRKMTADQERMAVAAHASGEMSVTQIAAALGLGRSTIYRAINRARA